MKWIVCIGEEGGILFHNRRISRDLEVCKDILEHLPKGQKLWMHPDSAKLFAFCEDKRIAVDAGFLQKASQGEYCFVENGAAAGDFCGVEEIIIYRWNRRYPWDVRFEETRCKKEFYLDFSTEFPGKSHEKITKEVYKR